MSAPPPFYVSPPATSVSRPMPSVAQRIASAAASQRASAAAASAQQAATAAQRAANQAATAAAAMNLRSATAAASAPRSFAVRPSAVAPPPSRSSARSSSSGGSVFTDDDTFSDDIGSMVENTRGQLSNSFSQFGEFAVRKALWLLLIAAVLVFVFLYVIARDRFRDVQAWVDAPMCFAHPWIVSIGLLVCLLLAAWATADAVMYMDTAMKSITVGCFFAVAVLFIAFTYFAYRTFNFLLVFYLMLLLLVVGLVHFLLIWTKCPPYKWVKCVPLVVALCFLVYFSWKAADDSATDFLLEIVPVHAAA